MIGVDNMNDDISIKIKQIATDITNFEQLDKNVISHPSQIAKLLKKIRKIDEDRFYSFANTIPNELFGEVILELPEHHRNDILEKLSNKKLVNIIHELDTDDATDLIQDIEEIDQNKADSVLENLDKDEKDDITWLKRYDDDQAGAFMQTEVFSAKVDETINDAKERFKQLKANNELENVYQVFISNEENELIASIPLEELFIADFGLTFEKFLAQSEDKFTPMLIDANTKIDEVVKIFEEYNLSVMPVVGYRNRLLGRITADDMFDIIEDSATEQIYNLAGVQEDTEHEDSLKETIKKRGNWLFINLITAILASITIGFFEDTIQAYVALAILMPIVASMGGNAGTQTLTVIVRQLALGEVNTDNAKDAIKKEVIISLFNGFAFAIITGIVAFIWFGESMLGVVIGLSMVLNLLFAGFFGSIIPIVLKKLEIDPAIGSTVLLTTITDIAGFFSFLMLAKYILL
jgi:magnesium transporter